MAEQIEIMQNLFKGDLEQKTALQFAFYNNSLLLLTICIGGMVFAIYNMMYMFLSPILWAILVGVLLFPLKRTIKELLENWLNRLDQNDTPLVVGFFCLPIDAVNAFSNKVYTTFTTTNGLYITGVFLVLKALTYNKIFLSGLNLVGELYSFFESCIDVFSQKIILTLVFFYSVAYISWLYVHEKNQLNKKFARTLSLPIYVALLCWFSNFFAAFKVIVFITLTVVLSLIALGIVAGDGNTKKDDVAEINGDETTETNEGDKTENEKDEDVIENNITSKHNKDVINSDAVKNTSKPINEVIGETIIDQAEGTYNIIYGMFALVFLQWATRHDSVLFLALFGFVVSVLKNAFRKIGIAAWFNKLWQHIWAKIQDGTQNVINIMVAGSLRKFFKLMFTSDKMFLNGFASSVDFISSIGVMALLFVCSIIAVIFSGFLLHAETIHLVKLGQNIISSQPDYISTVLNYTGKQIKEHDIDDYVEQMYEQGRTWVSAKARDLAPQDTARADQLEEQAKKFIDNLYKIYESRMMNDSTMASISNSSVDQLMSATNWAGLKEELTNVIKQNVDTLVSISKAIWAVFALNLTLLSNVIGSMLWFILGFGLDVVNFLLALIIFLTVVYHLLANSKDIFMPFKVISNIIKSVSAQGNSKNGTNIVESFEAAISSVFVLSFKMAVFYLLYTYFISTLFEIQIVFIPSMLAAFFATVPIVPHYSVSLIGFIELLLVRSETVASIVFLLLSIAPVICVEGAFYKEVKGSHPYITGLTILGGLYWPGLLQGGFIIAPIVLCLIMVLLDVYFQFAKSS